jgi:hypothetical protein
MIHASTKVINGSQMTLQWHVDNVMINHPSAREINVFLQNLKYIYGNNIAESTGKIHDCFGVQFNSHSKARSGSS